MGKRDIDERSLRYRMRMMIYAKSGMDGHIQVPNRRRKLCDEDTSRDFGDIRVDMQDFCMCEEVGNKG